MHNWKIFFLGVSVCAVVLSAIPSMAQEQEAAPADSGAASERGTLVISDAPQETPPQTPVAPTATVAPAAPAATAAPDVTNAPAQPAQVELKAEEPKNSELTPLPGDAQGEVAGTNVMGDSGADQRHSGTYYDANALVPDSELANAGVTGPRKIDPAYEPGSRFVVVERGGRATSYEAQYVAATRALKLERYAAAMEMFQKLYSRHNKEPRVLMGLAIAQQGAGFSESAARTYEELLAIDPNNPDAVVNLMGIMRGQYPSVTLRKLSDLRDKFPTNPGIPAQMALISAESGEYQEAMKYFEIAASMEPTNPSHIYNMAIVLDKKGDAKGAIRFYERALLLDASRNGVESSVPRDQIYDRLVVLRRKI